MWALQAKAGVRKLTNDFKNCLEKEDGGPGIRIYGVSMDAPSESNPWS
jgi:hypothetical protein